MSKVQVDQKTYEMPPREGFTVAHFLTVADVERSLRFYETVFGGRILSRGDSSGAPGYIQIANTWLLVNPGGGPTPDKPTVTLSVPPDPNRISSFMNSTHHIRSSAKRGNALARALPLSPVGVPSAVRVCAMKPTAIVLETTTIPISESVPCQTVAARAPDK